MDWNKLLSARRMRPSTRDTQFDLRNEFESDYGRIVFSPAIRRMHDKTQVFPLTSDDNIHTRLTHSLEVSSVAHSIGVNICLRKEFNSRFTHTTEDLLRMVPTILSSISLCHDIGNPPFGHYGEKVISKFFKEYFHSEYAKSIDLTDDQRKDFENFDGNAQGFRILTKLQTVQDKYGINLTVGTLSAFLKYPNLAPEINIAKKDYKNRLGVFWSESKTIEFIRRETKLKNVRNPLAFLMEAADSICYLVMDMEDGFNKGYYNYEEILNFLFKYCSKTDKKVVEKIKNKIEEKVRLNTINEKRTRIINLRILLIQELVNTAVNVFIKNIDKIDQGIFERELIYINKKCLANALKTFTAQKILGHREIQTLELTGESVLVGMLNYFAKNFIDYKNSESHCAKTTKKLYSLISNDVISAVYFETGIKDLTKLSDYYKLRLVVDYIAGMTDQFALKIYQKITGIRIN